MKTAKTYCAARPLPFSYSSDSAAFPFGCGQTADVSAKAIRIIIDAEKTWIYNITLLKEFNTFLMANSTIFTGNLPYFCVKIAIFCAVFCRSFALTKLCALNIYAIIPC